VLAERGCWFNNPRIYLEAARNSAGKARKGVGVARGKELKLEDGETSHTLAGAVAHTRWSGGRGYLRREVLE
jgi:hypothetical protein